VSADGDGIDRPGDAVLKLARQEPSAVLLGAQLAGVLLYPFLEAAGAGGHGRHG
jgi:hypothetical protein